MGVKFWHIASYREICKSLIFFKIGGYIFITSLGVSLLLLPPKENNGHLTNRCRGIQTLSQKGGSLLEANTLYKLYSLILDK